jgi:hypothetical protein
MQVFCGFRAEPLLRLDPAIQGLRTKITEFASLLEELLNIPMVAAEMAPNLEVQTTGFGRTSPCQCWKPCGGGCGTWSTDRTQETTRGLLLFERIFVEACVDETSRGLLRGDGGLPHFQILLDAQFKFAA